MVSSHALDAKRFIGAGAFLLGAVVLITLYPATKIGFLGDDWWEVANAGRMSLPQFLRFYFDPGAQTIWYRPLHGILLLIEYPFFGSNAEGYRIVQTLLHGANSLLLFGIGYQITRRWRWAFLIALFYAVFYPGGSAVFGIAVHDPLALVFCLVTVLAWVLYLKSECRLYYWLTVGSFGLALLSKETSAVLIVTLFLVDRVLIAQAATLRALFRKYSVFALILLFYLAIEYRVQVQGHFATQSGYTLGFNVVENALRYLGQLVFPWSWDQPAAFVWLVIILGLIVAALFRNQRLSVNQRVVFFLSAQLILAIAPVLGFATMFYEARYLYAASIVAVVVLTWLIEKMRRGLTPRKASIVIPALAVAFIALLHSASLAESANELAEFNRQARVPFRDIVQQHPAFSPDTSIYLINPPYLLSHAAPSLFFFRYGSNVSIGTVEPEWWGGAPGYQGMRLRDHQNSFVYYYDESGNRHEVEVVQSAQTKSTPGLPVEFQKMIQLNGYDVTSNRLKQNSALVLLLNWQATQPIDRDYTVFVHLVDNNGQVVAGEDDQPQNGAMPTHTWKTGKVIVDSHILPITSDLPVGDGYRLEVGLYFLPTLERLGIVDAIDQVVKDTLVIEPFSVVE